MNGQVVSVQGIVTGSWPTGSNNRFWIQDATGGINVFGTPQLCSVALGQDIQVTGTLTVFNGLTEIASPLTLAVVSSGNPQPAPLLLTIAMVRATYQGDNCEPNESKLIMTTGFLRTSTGAMPAPGATFAANTNYRLINVGPDSTTNFTTVRSVQSTNACGTANPLVGQTIPVDCPVDVTGVLAQFDSSLPYNDPNSYQIQPRSGADIVVNCATSVQPSTWGRIKAIYR